ncbi:MAG: hypothetical protein R2795_24015 [Saprospiraceae bacterium]
MSLKPIFSYRIIWGVLLVGWFPFATVVAQERLLFEPCDQELLCSDFAAILANTIHFLDEENGAEAYRELKALEACDKCPEHRDNIDALSDEIIALFRKQNELFQQQNERLNDVVAAQKSTLAALTRTNRDLTNARTAIDKQLLVNQQVTREALVSNYMSLARNYYEDDLDGKGRNEALWLTDFTYSYIDSLHPAVHSMLYQLLNDEISNRVPHYLLEYDENWEEVLSEEEELTAISWSADGRWLALSTSSGQLSIFNEDGQVVFQRRQLETIMQMAWSHSGNRLAVLGAGIGNNISFISLDAAGQWAPAAPYIQAAQSVFNMKWSPNEEDILAIAGDNNTVEFYRVTGEETLAPFQTLPSVHEDWVRALAWSPDGKYLATGDDDGKIACWEVATNTLRWQQQRHSDYIRTLAWHPAGHELVSGSDDYQLIYWTPEGEESGRRQMTGWILQVDYSSTGHSLGVWLSVGQFVRITDGEEYTMDISTTLPGFAWRGEDNTVEDPILSVGMSSAAAFYVPPATSSDWKSLPEDGRLEEWGADSEEYPGEITHVAWSPDGDLLAYVKDGNLCLQTDSLTRIIDMEGNGIRAMAWHKSQEGQLTLTTADSGNGLIVWNPFSGTAQRIVPLEVNAMDMAWSPTGNTLAIVHQGRGLLLMNESLAFLHEVELHTDWVRSIAWSPNGRRLATASDDRTVVIWNVDAQRREAVLSGHTDWVRSVVWLDDNRLFTTGDDRKVLLWEQGDGNNFVSKVVTEELGGYGTALACNSNPTASALAVGTTEGVVEIWMMEHRQDDAITLVDTLRSEYSGITDLAWHPNRGALAIATYGVVPTIYHSISGVNKDNLLGSRQRKVINTSFLDASDGQSMSVTDWFYFPDIKVANEARYPYDWSADSRYLAAILSHGESATDGVMELHDMEAHQRALIYQFDATLWAVRFAPNGKKAALVAGNGHLILLNIPTGIPDTIVDTSCGIPLDVAWSADSRYLAIATEDLQLLIYDAVGHELQSCAGVWEAGEVVVRFDPQNSRQLFIGTDKGLYLQTIPCRKTAEQVFVPNGIAIQDYTNELYNNITWMEDGRMLYAQRGYPLQWLSTNGGSVKPIHEMGEPGSLFTWTTSRQPRLFEYRRQLIPYNPDESYNGTDLQYIRGWDVAGNTPASTIRSARTLLCNQLAVSPDGGLLAAIGDRLTESEGKYQVTDHRLVIWDTRSQQEVVSMEVPYEIHTLTFSPDSRQLLLHSSSGRVSLLPLDIRSVHQWAISRDKDKYLRQLTTKANDPFQNRIVEWQLERGIKLNASTSSQRMVERENIAIREGWSKYFVDQAWLATDVAQAHGLFEQAAALHTAPGTSRILPTAKDTSAVAFIWIERAYFEQLQGRLKEADTWVAKAARLSPEQEQLQLWEVLNKWQRGQEEPVVRMLLGEDNALLLDALLQWKRRDITVRNEAFLNRLTDVSQYRYDSSAGIFVEPDIWTQTQALPAELRYQVTTRYCRINTNQAYGDGLKLRLLEKCLSEMDTYPDLLAQDKDGLGNYLRYVYELQSIDAIANDVNQVVSLIANAREKVKMLLQLMPDDSDVRSFAFNVETDYLYWQLVQHPEQATNIQAQLKELATTYSEQEQFYLPVVQGYCEAVAGNIPAAWQYLQPVAMHPYFNITTDRAFIEGQLSRVDAAAMQALVPGLDLLEDFITARDRVDATPLPADVGLVNTPEDAAMRLDEHNNRWQLTTDAYLLAEKCQAASVCPVEVVSEQAAQLSSTAAVYVWTLLRLGDWETAADAARRTSGQLPNLNWPQGVEALAQFIRNEGKGMDATLSRVARLTNDGFSPDTYPLMRDWMLNLPPQIQALPDFNKWYGKWKEGVGDF